MSPSEANPDFFFFSLSSSSPPLNAERIVSDEETAAPGAPSPETLLVGAALHPSPEIKGHHWY